MAKSELKDAWSFPDRECFRGLWAYIKLGISSCTMMLIEFASFAAMTLMSGYISVESMAGQIIIGNTRSVLFLFAVGLYSAASAVIGMSMGSGNAK